MTRAGHPLPLNARAVEWGPRGGITRVEFTCQGCGASKVAKHETRHRYRFCSVECSGRTRFTPEHNRATGRKYAKQIGDARRDTGSADWYRKVEGRHEHRAVAEAALGRKLTSDEVVHHINEDKKDNRRENLQVLTRGEHCRLHWYGETFNHGLLPVEEVMPS